MDKHADLAINKIILWVLLLAFLIFMMIFLLGLDDKGKTLIEGFFSFFE